MRKGFLQKITVLLFMAVMAIYTGITVTAADPVAQIEEKLLVDTDSGEGYYTETSGTWYQSNGVKGYDGSSTRYSMSQYAAAEWYPVVAEEGEYLIRVYHPVHSSDVENDVKISVFDAEGEALVAEEMIWDGTENAGWIEFGNYELEPGKYTVRLEKLGQKENPNSAGAHDQALRADAAEFVKQSEEADPSEGDEIVPMPQADYYVDATNGNDENEGTGPDTAWKTLEKVNGCSFAPGSRILLKKGETWIGRLAPQGSGTENAPIILGSYGDGEQRPVIHGNGCADGAVGLYNQEYWEIIGLEVTNNLPGEELGNRESNIQTRHGIYIRLENFDTEGDHTAEHIYVKECYVHDIVGNLGNPHNGVGIFYFVSDAGDQSRFHDIMIDRNEVQNVDRSGIIIRSQDISDPDTTYNTNVVIQNNYVENIAGDGIVAKVSNGAMIQYNEVNHACARATGGNVNNAAVWVWQCKDSVIQYNEVYHTGLLGGNKDGQAFDSDYNCEGCVIQYNYSHDNDGGLVLIIAPSSQDFNRNTVVRYNISENDKKDVIEVSGAVENAKIYNNTIYQGEECPTNLLRVNTYFGVPESAWIQNNIFYSEAEDTTTMTETDNGRPFRGSITFDHNIFWGFPVLNSVDKEVDEIVGGIRYKGHWKLSVENSVEKNPLLTNPGQGDTGIDFADAQKLAGYHILKDSPAVNAGAQIEGNGGRDFWGAVLDDVPDIGAREYVGLSEPEKPDETEESSKPEKPEDPNKAGKTDDFNQNESAGNSRTQDAKGEEIRKSSVQTGDSASVWGISIILAPALGIAAVVLGIQKRRH